MTVRKRTYARKGGTQTTWMVDVIFYHPDGTRERYRKLSPVQTKRGAEKYDREVRELLLAKSLANRQRADRKRLLSEENQETKLKRAPTLNQFAIDFIKIYAESNNKPSEVYGKRMVLKNHLLPAFGRKKMDQITVKDIEAMKAEKLRKGLAAKTVNNMLAVLGKALRTAKAWGLIQLVPEIQMLRLPVLEHSFLSFAEGHKLIVAMDTIQFKAMATVALRTGLRLGELRALRWQDVDLTNTRIIVRRAAWQDKVGAPKSGKAREVGLSKQVIRALRNLPKRDCELTVFCDDEGNMLTKGACKWPLWRACDSSNLGKRVGWHILRHTFASHLAMRGVALKIIQELLGHSDMKMTMRYAHLTPQVRQEAVDLLDSMQ